MCIAISISGEFIQVNKFLFIRQVITSSREVIPSVSFFTRGQVQVCHVHTSMQCARLREPASEKKKKKNRNIDSTWNEIFSRVLGEAAVVPRALEKQRSPSESHRSLLAVEGLSRCIQRRKYGETNWRHSP